MTFDHMLAFTAIWSLAFTAHAADELSFKGDAKERLSGIVTAIEESGVIELASPLTDEPLRLKPDAVERVRFGIDGDTSKPSAMLVELVNGDRLPVEVVSYSAEKGMRIHSPVVGELVLPPSVLTSLELGTPAHKMAFEGPGDTSGWSTTQKNGFENVSVDGKDWTINGRLEASRQLDIPKNFTLRFVLQWGVRQQPNIKVHFASPDVNSFTKADRYFLQFSSAGFEVKRERENNSGFPSILISNRLPQQFTAREVEVEIHVNRTTKRLELYLNGELESWGIDPEPAPPMHGGIILGINGTNGTSHTIRDLSVYELDNMRVRHRAEDRGGQDQDSLISRKDDRWAGELREIRNQGGQTDFIFKTPLRKEPLEIPIDDISTVFFRKASAPAQDMPAKYRLQLRGEGGLSVKSCRIADGKITVVHPLLGELSLSKGSILGIGPASAPQEEGNKVKNEDEKDEIE